MTLTEIKQSLAGLEASPSKSLGQNFLHDQNLAQWMIRQLEPAPTDRFIEIGPGLGALTEWLLPQVASVTAIEKDAKMVGFLQERFVDHSNFTIRHEDACESDLRQFLVYGPHKLIGNLPYYVSTAILLNFLSAPTPVTHALFTIQREVAERLTAQPGTASYGSLTIAVQRRWQVKYLRTLPPTVFYPEPHVDSAVVLLTALPPEQVQPVDGGVFEKTVRQGFSQRRKQLRKMLAISTDEWPTLAAQIGVPLQCRAEELSLSQWVALVQAHHPIAQSVAQEPGSEIFDVVDDQNVVIAQATRGEVHAKNWNHRAVHIFVYNRAGELFLQKRSHRKDRQPGKWDSSAAGHLDAGETYLAAAQREIVEELGVSAEVTLAGRLPSSEQTGYEFIEIYRAQAEGPFHLHPLEIETGAFFPQALVAEWIETRPQDFAPGFLECFRLLENGLGER
ncbi:MAG: 16S rRNA (adenine(1518)-N(6)/adenine(1519)-N(6))-dimethyltransferase RsmA [Chthoniobacterales bacterium]